ncbi:MAG: archaeal flagellin FlaB [Thermococcaceae archaeon]|nr:archaeal flagellin FlaB [Thermococcaceae archaeon]
MILLRVVPTYICSYTLLYIITNKKFIAMVLVAAVAAAVLINTSGYLQQRAEATGRQTTKEVSSGVKIDKVLGFNNGGTIDKLAIQVSLNAGSEPVDLNQTKVYINDGSNFTIYSYESTATGTDFSAVSPSAGKFQVVIVQDADNSVTDDHTLTPGDIVFLVVDNLSLDPRTAVTIEVRPEFGAPGFTKVVTPPAYTEDVIELK